MNENLVMLRTAIMSYKKNNYNIGIGSDSSIDG
jgi:hypothetical protein